MTSSQTKLTGSGPVNCECGNHRDRCHFGRQHVMTTPWTAGDGIWHLTWKCFTCGSVCLTTD